MLETTKRINVWCQSVAKSHQKVPYIPRNDGHFVSSQIGNRDEYTKLHKYAPAQTYICEYAWVM